MKTILRSALLLVVFAMSLANLAEAKNHHKRRHREQNQSHSTSKPPQGSCKQRSTAIGEKIGLDASEAQYQAESAWVFRDLLDEALADNSGGLLTKVTLTLAKKACVEYGVVGIYQNSRYVHISYPRVKEGKVFDLEVNLRDPMVLEDIYNMGLYTWGHVVSDIKFEFSNVSTQPAEPPAEDDVVVSDDTTTDNSTTDDTGAAEDQSGSESTDDSGELAE